MKDCNECGFQKHGAEERCFDCKAEQAGKRSYIQIEYLRMLDSEKRRFNNLDLKDIAFIENGKIIEIPEKYIEDFQYVGLSNMDFILGEYYKKPFFDEENN